MPIVTPRRIGILGGMGPQATVLLMDKLIAAVPAADDRDHIPLIVDQNTQVPSRIRRLIEGTGDDPEPVLVEMARRLEQAGAEALAMPCNTTHHYAGAIAASVRIPMLSLVEVSVERALALSAASDGRIGIIASPAVRMTALFDGPLRACGLTPVYPADEAAVLDAIRRIKASGVDDEARSVMHRTSSQLLADGVQVQMVACTELSLIMSECAVGSLAFDTLDALVDAIKTFALHG
ncbi:MAG TPA: amino acid racemase [Xanthobacteraceae bacterium]|jgi:aspartate racemase|nr:MAG: aspartate racemase [Rhizobiales bacterium 12-66-7]HQS07426.1 amino acid racemase [Xanthobacteraceae bacterium]HQS46706.1 amino acid racemase [Xanthobacteraceae bacterium]